MSDKDEDRALLLVSAVGVAWGLNQIRRYAPRLWVAINFLMVVIVTSVLIWITVDLWHYMLTTPSCERVGTCAAPPSAH